MPIAIIVVLLVAVLAAIGIFTFTNTDTDSTATGVEEAIEVEVEDDDPMTPPSTIEITPPTSDPPVVSSNDYGDGTYVASAAYYTPKRGRHDLSITLTIEDDVIQSVSLLYDGDDDPDNSHQERFDNSIASVVVGVPLADLSVSRVGAASLTTDAFNEAVADIKTEAEA